MGENIIRRLPWANCSSWPCTCDMRFQPSIGASLFGLLLLLVRPWLCMCLGWSAQGLCINYWGLLGNQKPEVSRRLIQNNRIRTDRFTIRNSEEDWIDSNFINKLLTDCLSSDEDADLRWRSDTNWQSLDRNKNWPRTSASLWCWE